MKLLEAFEILRRPFVPEAPVVRVGLACGFTPLHLQTFLAARLRSAWPGKNVQLESGHFGDMAGNIVRLSQRADALCAPIEWTDLDRRLGIRSLGQWAAADLPDILATVESEAGRLTQALLRAAESRPVYAALPTLPLPPAFPQARWQAAHAESRLREISAAAGTALAANPRIRLVSPQWLDERVPPGRRFDPTSELRSGCPYTLEHADALAEGLALAMAPPPVAKGLITDLDGTLWEGLVGEIGAANVRWAEQTNAHLHGLYQRFLGSLASAGVMLAVASKNDPDPVAAALSRPDLLITPSSFFPVEVGWGPKSEAVSRILSRWNISARDVVFVDDSRWELEEVHTRHPEMECFAFPSGDAAALWGLIGRLRDRCGKAGVSAEDAVRIESVRRSGLYHQARAAEGQESALRRAQGVITLSIPGPEDERAFELINKTNQFNLNGGRWTRAEWLAFLRRPDSQLLAAAYEDKFGPLGKVAVLAGTRQGRSLRVRSWVMSCRAFSRQIEHECLRYLFHHLQPGPDAIEFDFAPTPRNTPTREFLATLLDSAPSGPFTLPRSAFESRCPRPVHRVAAPGILEGGERPAGACAVPLQGETEHA